MKKFFALFACMLNIAWASAQFSGSGSGTSSDPYRIFNADQLSQMRNFLNQEGVYFKLQNNLDLTAWLADNYPGQGWQPVGSSSEPFKGVLDGNGKTISGFSITRSTMDYVGLFGYVSGATIYNLTLKGTVSGKAYVGSLMGGGSATVSIYTFEGTVTGSDNYVGGVGGSQTTASTNLSIRSATVSGASYVGGIYGSGAGLTTALFSGQVTGSDSYVGGLEGEGNGTFSACNVSATVKSTGLSAQYVGGLIGYSTDNITINSSTHRGNITGATYTGGVIGGSNNAALNLTSCYVEGNITGTMSVGGICGYIKNPATSNISGCNFWGDISGESYLGGVVGQIIISNNNINFSATTTAGYKTSTNFRNTACFYNSSSPSISGNSSGGYVSSSYIATGIGEWVKSSHTVNTGSSSTSTTSAPYIVYKNIRVPDSSSSGIYVNIQNCSAVSNIEGTGTYIGGIVGKDVESTNNEICTLSQSKTVWYYQGNGTTSTISSITLKKYSYVYTTSNISESYFSGTIVGTNYLGGIAGTKEGGRIDNCYASASISGGQYAGGIAGCLTKGTFNTNENSMNANVSACTKITGTSNVGRIYGSTDDNFSVAALGTNSENRSMASTQVVVNGVTQTITDNLQQGTAVGISQLRLRANYVAWGWDFNNCWTLQETESLPYKTWQSAPPTFSGNLISGATTISGQSTDGGTIYLETNSGQTYRAFCTGSSWSVNVSALHAGETVTAYADAANKEKSYFTTATVGYLGSGTEADPYQITCAEDLQGINRGGYYKIMRNIDLTLWINQYSPTAGWLPVGYDGAPVYIDGDNHKISGLWTNSTDTYTGLFSRFKDGYIKNLKVEVRSGKKVKGGQYTGCIISYATNFEISNCSVKGDVQGTGDTGGLAGYFVGNSSNPNLTNISFEGTSSSTTASARIGGIAGYASNCRLSNAYAGTQATSTGNNALVGGLVGEMNGLEASQCTADVNINASGTGNKVGGLFGTAANANIAMSYSIGSVQTTGADSWIGGIAGSLTTGSLLSDSYSTATLTGTQYTAGLVGKAVGGSKINRCYASGNLTGIYYGAGIVGYLNNTNSKTANCVALNNILTFTDQSAWASRVIGGYDNAAGDPDGSNLALATMQVSLNDIPVTKYDDLVEGIAKSEAQLKQSATYTAMGWDFTDVWTIDEGNGYPRLKWDAAGNGTEANPYQITCAEDLQGINRGGYYKIMNDIDLTAWINQYSPTAGWLPVGYDSDPVYIDGDNHKISGLWTNSTDTYTGLFSRLENGYIKNLEVEVPAGKKVKGGANTGILIGFARIFEISNCSVKGDVQGTGGTGGLVGYFMGNSSNPNLTNISYEGALSSTADNAYIGGIMASSDLCRMSNASVTAQITSTGGSAVVGGLVGWAKATFGTFGSKTSQCVAHVNITTSGTNNYVGGLCGRANSDSIATSYSTGTIQVNGDNSNAGGIVGWLSGNGSTPSELADSYSTVTLSGTQYTAGLVGKATLGARINRCYASGNVTGIYNGAGIVSYLSGHYDRDASISSAATNCVALNNILTFTDQSAWASRVIGGYDEAAGDPDGSNLALATMQVSLNNIPVTKYDDLVEGIAKSEAQLKQAATYTAMGWDFTDVWGIDEGNGYPYLKWAGNVTPTPTPVTPGDANGDGEANVTDYMAIANFILGQNPTDFNETAADVNEDGSVNVADYVGVANIILYGNYTGSTGNAVKAYTTDNRQAWMEIEEENGLLNLRLHDAKTFSAFQMNISLPEGVEIANARMAKASQSRNLGIAHLNDGTWQLLYGTLENNAVQMSDDCLLTLELKGCNGGYIEVDNIILAMPDASMQYVYGVNAGLSTGISSVNNSLKGESVYYDLTGRRVIKTKKGVYVVNGKKMLIK